MARHRPYVKSLYWLPAYCLSRESVEDAFTVHVSEHSETGSVSVPYRVWKLARGRDGTLWVGLPRGQPGLVRACLKDKRHWRRIRDRTADPQVEIDLRFNGTYYGYQREAVLEWAEHDHGCLASAPRTGKSCMAVAVAVEHQTRTLILAHQRDLIEQICNETVNDPSGRLFDGASAKSPVAGICRTLDEFERYPICLATYQTFLSRRGQMLLGRVKDMFGLVIVDEAHRASARAYSKIVSRFSARRMYSMTATPDRKDGAWPISELIIGPVVHRTNARALRAVVTGIDATDRFGLRGTSTFAGMINQLADNEARNEWLARMILKDVAKGHCVLVPVARLGQVEHLVKRINDRAGRELAVAFTGRIPKDQRQTFRDRLNNDRSVRVTVAIRSMLTGMNVPRWSCVAADTYMPCEKGLVRMGDLFKGWASESSLRVHNGDRFARISFGGRRRYARTKIVELANGHRIECTFKHKFLCLTPDFELEFRNADALKPGDHVIRVSAGSMVRRRYNLKDYSFDPQRHFGVFHHRDMDGKATCPECGIRTANLVAHAKSAHGSNDGIEWTGYQKYLRWKALTRRNIEYPTTVGRDLAYLMGFLVTDGSVRKGSVEFYNKDKRLIGRIVRKMRAVFGAEPTIVHTKDTGVVNLVYRDIRLVDFVRYLGIEGRSWQKHVPRCIMESPSDVVAAFLSAHLDGDGCVHQHLDPDTSKRSTVVQFLSSNAACLEQLQLLLVHHFDINARIARRPQSFDGDGPRMRARGGASTKYRARHIPGVIECTNAAVDNLREALVHSLKVRTRLTNRHSPRTAIPYGKAKFRDVMVGARKELGQYRRQDGSTENFVYKKVKGWGGSVETVRANAHVLNTLRAIDPAAADVFEKMAYGGYRAMEVRSIEDTEGEKPVYDVTMADESKPQYVSGMVVSHNCLWEVTPMSNIPSYTQEVLRICTPMEGKKRPVVRYVFNGEYGMGVGCLVTSAKVLCSPDNGFAVHRSFAVLPGVADVRRKLAGG